MTDLIFHIGLPRTGTTTIQQVLNPLDNYLGKLKGIKLGTDLARRFKKITPSHDLPGWHLEAEKWAREVDAWQEQRRRTIKQLIVSDEGLARIDPSRDAVKWPIGTNGKTFDRGEELPRRQIIYHLQSLQDKVWQQGAVKALLVLRNQSDWLGSLYAHRSKKLSDASQTDFEHQIDHLIRIQESYLDWSLWVDELRSALGTENVCILLLEDMHNSSFWQELANFTGVDSASLNSLTTGEAPKKNQKGSGRNTWPLWPARDQKKGSLTGGVVNYYWQTNKAEYLRRLTRAAATQFSRSVWDLDGPARRYLESKGLELEIEMTPELREKVKKYCDPFNKRLAEQLRRDDLSKLGY